MNLEEIKERVGKWNKICDAFTNKLGWDRGFSILLMEKHRVYPNTSITDLSDVQFNRLTNSLRKSYRAYVKK
jgi:hypothetical protein